jgi:molybdate/tungstate transport system substrate-binding protein
MRLTRRAFHQALGASAATLTTALARAGAGAGPITVAYAGSMGVLMNDGLGPAFRKHDGAGFHGIGQGAFGLARRIKAGTLTPDVFVSVTPGPIHLLSQANLIGPAAPVASTAMVIAYSGKSSFAPQLAKAAKGDAAWYEVLESKGLRFGRTDPRTDPQGRNIIFTFDLAGRYYHKPHLARRILGPAINPKQIFTETSLLARLDAGALDATSGYESAVKSLNLPFIALPKQINLSDPAMASRWYDHVSLTLKDGGEHKTVQPQPLVFYATVLKKAAQPRLAQRFVSFLQSDQGQALFAKYGYNPPLGGTI